jgi:hypothetical protein
MSEDYFSFDDYNAKTEDPEKYTSDPDTPMDYQKDTADGAIDYRQSNQKKGNKENVLSNKQVQHGENSKSATRRIRERQEGEPISLEEHNHENGEKDDPANW